ncbi:hypothetical protein OROHE_016906 [Orobanche hederae]
MHTTKGLYIAPIESLRFLHIKEVLEHIAYILLTTNFFLLQIGNLAMASSQTTSFTEKKKESIIDGCLFVQAIVMERVQTENINVAVMEHVVSRIKQTGLFNLGKQRSDLYDESLVEEFYREASVRFCLIKRGGDVAEISATIREVETRINRHLLEDLFSLPSSGLKIEELESFGSEDLLSTFWCDFIGPTRRFIPHVTRKDLFCPSSTCMISAVV